MKAAASILAIVLSASTACAGNWPAWRGPDANGVAPDATVPAELSLDRSWKVELPGRGCSTPIVWDGKVIVTGPDGDTDTVFAFDLKSGRELWRRGLGEARKGRTQKIGSSANSSPITDGKHIFVYFKSGTLASLDFNGEVAWKINVEKDFAEDGMLWDKGTSPVFADGRLVIAAVQDKSMSYLVSLDKGTGRKVWLTERKTDAEGETRDSYATPFVVTLDGVETIVTWGADYLTGHDAKSGRELWRCGGFNPGKQKLWRNIASASWSGDVAIVPFGREELVAGIRMGGSGDITDKAWLWKHSGWGSDTATPAARDGKALVLTDRGKERGTLTLLAAESGKVIWQVKLPKSVQTFCASPLVAGKRVVLARQDGTVFTATITREGIDDLKQVELDEGLIASPVPAGDGRLLIRGDEHLYCFW
jgi:outer membrane protein assembly factor BamB